MTGRVQAPAGPDVLATFYVAQALMLQDLSLCVIGGKQAQIICILHQIVDSLLR